MSSSEPKFRQEIQQVSAHKLDCENISILNILEMMYVSGETLDPSTETILLIETLVQQQVFHMVSGRPFRLNCRMSHIHSS